MASMKWGIITWKEMKDTSYRPKDITSPEEAFSFMDKLITSRENAFLLRGNECPEER